MSNLDRIRSQIRRSRNTDQIQISGFDTITVKELSAADLLVVSEQQGDSRIENMITAIIAATITDSGEPFFEDTEETRAVLRELTQDETLAWFLPILRLSGIDTDKLEEEDGDLDAKKDLASVSNLPTG